MNLLQDLVDSSLREAADRAHVSSKELKDMIAGGSGKRSLKESLSRPGIGIIAEFKRCSPSSHSVQKKDLADQIQSYQKGGASALSILTNHTYFKGSLSDLSRARQLSDLPILRKEFITSTYQILESAAMGADAILLIARIMDDTELSQFISEAKEVGLECLVETHSETDVKRALRASADIIGINNRDLNSDQIDLDTTLNLANLIPDNKVAVSESGISQKKDLVKIARSGIDAVLIGNALMKSPDPKRFIFSLKPSGPGAF